MSVNKIIQESIGKNPLGVKEALEEALQDRIRAALEEKYKKMAMEHDHKDEDDDEDEDDEDEDDLDESSLNELSPSLLKRYARTADKSVEKRKPGESDADYYKRGDKRQTGADMAFDKYKKQTKKGPMVVKKAFEKESFDLSDLTLEELDEAKGSFSGAFKRAEASRQSALKKAAAMVKKGFSHEVAAKNHDVKVDEIKKHMSEEVEQIYELKKSTLGSYVKKASERAVSDKVTADRLSRRAFDAKDRDVTKAYLDVSDEMQKKHKNRLAGIAKATDRLAKESFDLSDLTLEELEDFMMSEDFDQLDEISKKTLASYVKKASSQASKDFNTYGTQKRKSSRLASRAMASGTGTAAMKYDKEAQDAMDKGTAAMKRYDKRDAGIDRAKDRLAK